MRSPRKAMGIHVTSIKITAFVLGAAIAGVAGCLDAHYMFYIDSHNYNFGRSVEMLLFLILGGSEVIWGPVLGRCRAHGARPRRSASCGNTGWFFTVSS